MASLPPSLKNFGMRHVFEALQDIMLKILKTDRKRGGWLILVSQSPEDAISCPIFPAIVQQTPTKIFLPNPDLSMKTAMNAAA